MIDMKQLVEEYKAEKIKYEEVKRDNEMKITNLESSTKSAERNFVVAKDRLLREGQKHDILPKNSIWVGLAGIDEADRIVKTYEAFADQA